ncbi:MAG TPA: hypothetical protein VMS64_18070 [Candidatus Methylomirabilis sp.]|nr:hypothetical protein [Candidatus Methylomirabilis sp.]
MGRLKSGMLTQLPEGWGDGLEIHNDCIEAVRDAAQLCLDLGHVVEEIAPDVLVNAYIMPTFGTIFSALIGYAVAYRKRELGKTITESDLEPMT